jgi:hypothetical protein
VVYSKPTVQASEQEQSSKKANYERRILKQIDKTDAMTAEILLQMQTGIAHTPTGADGIAQHSESAEILLEAVRISANSTAGQSKGKEGSN